MANANDGWDDTGLAALATSSTTPVEATSEEDRRFG